MADILLDDRVISPHHHAQQKISTHTAVLPTLRTQRPAGEDTPRGPDRFGDGPRGGTGPITPTSYAPVAELSSPPVLVRGGENIKPPLRYPSTSSNVNNAGSQKCHGEAFRVTQKNCRTPKSSGVSSHATPASAHA